MANTDTPTGAIPYGKVLRVNMYAKDADASAIFQGSPVKMASDGYIEVAGAGEAILGFSGKYSAASTADAEIPVYDHPDQQFMMQDDAAATLARTNIGNAADLTAESGSTTTGISTVEIDASTPGAASGQVKIMDVADYIYPDGTVNAVGDNCNWIIQINEHFLKSTTAI